MNRTIDRTPGDDDDIILKRCQHAQKNHGREDAPVVLWMPVPRRSSGGIRLFPGGPKGTIVEQYDNGAAVSFNANDIISYVNRKERDGGKTKVTK